MHCTGTDLHYDTACMIMHLHCWHVPWQPVCWVLNVTLKSWLLDVTLKRFPCLYSHHCVCCIYSQPSLCVLFILFPGTATAQTTRHMRLIMGKDGLGFTLIGKSPVVFQEVEEDGVCVTCHTCVFLPSEKGVNIIAVEPICIVAVALVVVVVVVRCAFVAALVYLCTIVAHVSTPSSLGCIPRRSPG